MSADNQIAEILSRYGEDFRSQTWVVPGGKARAVLHACIERIVAQAGITFDKPEIVSADPANVVIIVTGRMGDAEAWSFGEASPKNNKNAYPYSMSEKRAKDRVALKLLRLHGLVYSEEEAEDFKTGRPASPPKLSAEAEAKRDRDWDKRQDQAYGTATVPSEVVNGVGINGSPSPEPIATVDVPLIKSSAQAKRDGDWTRIEATLKEAADQQSLAALLAWPSQQSGLLSGLKPSWVSEAEEAWRVAFAALLATECHNAAEVKQFGVEYREAIMSMPAAYVQACREVVTESLSYHRGQPAEDRVSA
jgi:hypothetical protein